MAGSANPNSRLCEKRLRAFDSLDADERLTSPLVRHNGDLVPVSWETALTCVITRSQKIISEQGPDKWAFLGAPRCTNEENFHLQKLARSLYWDK